MRYNKDSVICPNECGASNKYICCLLCSKFLINCWKVEAAREYVHGECSDCIHYKRVIRTSKGKLNRTLLEL